MTGAIAGAVTGAAVLLLLLYGWRMMRRSNWEKAVVLQGLVGQTVDLKLSFVRLITWEHVVFLRLQEGSLIVRDRDNDERVYPIEAIRAIQQGDRRCGPW